MSVEDTKMQFLLLRANSCKAYVCDLASWHYMRWKTADAKWILVLQAIPIHVNTRNLSENMRLFRCVSAIDVKYQHKTDDTCRVSLTVPKVTRSSHAVMSTDCHTSTSSCATIISHHICLCHGGEAPRAIDGDLLDANDRAVTVKEKNWRKPTTTTKYMKQP